MGKLEVLASCVPKQTLFIVHYGSTVPLSNFPIGALTLSLRKHLLTMPGQVRWATDEQTKFLVSHFSEYVDIYNTSKAYGPFWAKIKVDWLNLFPLDAGSMFPEKSDNELTAEEEGAVGIAIKKLTKVWIMINDLGDIFHMTNMHSKSKIGSDGA